MAGRQRQDRGWVTQLAFPRGVGLRFRCAREFDVDLRLGVFREKALHVDGERGIALGFGGRI